MQRRMPSLALPMALLAMTVVLTTAAANDERQEHCVTYLEPLGAGDEPGEVVAEPEDMGCYGTYAEALLAGSGGVTKLPAGVGPADLTQAILERATDDTTSSSYLLGTEFVDTGYGGSSNSYYAAGDCVGATWSVSWVGATWNDRFESGRGYSGCDHNKKFEHADFDGAVLTCTPNCSTYGVLNDEVSSLRWKD